jgi:hypothetical protein
LKFLLRLPQAHIRNVESKGGGGEIEL